MVEIHQYLIQMNEWGDISQPPACLIVVINRLSFWYGMLLRDASSLFEVQAIFMTQVISCSSYHTLH